MRSPSSSGLIVLGMPWPALVKLECLFLLESRGLCGISERSKITKIMVKMLQKSIPINKGFIQVIVP